MEFEQHLRNLEERFKALADGECVEGAAELAGEAERFLRRLQESAGDQQGLRLSSLIQSLQALADALSPAADSEDAPATRVIELDDFIETFRQEAEELLQGLSLSMMGIFGEDCLDAMSESAKFLHALRGGASMVGLRDFADIASAMEEVILSRRDMDPDARTWPTKTLLRAFALLQRALDDRDLQPGADAPQIGARLRASLRGPEPITLEVPLDDELLFEDSEPQDDSEFFLPRSDEAIEPTPFDGESDTEQPILIVDDVETVAASIGFILSDLEQPIEVARDGVEALALLEEHPFSLVITDVDMPRMDGVVLTRRIRANPALADLPVILLTSLDQPDERDAGLSAGATDYLIKGSIGGGELVSRVRELLADAPRVERPRPPARQRILVAEDTETVAASIAFVLSEGPFEILLATDGRDALRRMEQEPFDLLITDMQMPFMSGTELVRALRSDERHRQIPVIMLTSVQDEDAIAEATEVGVSRYLIKGEIAGGKLFSVVKELLNANAEVSE